MRRDLKALAGTAAVVTATASFAVLAGSTAVDARSTTSSAYGVSAAGALPFDMTPYVESSDGKTHTSSAVELPDNPLLSVRAGTVSAGNDAASVQLLDVGVGQGGFDQLPEPPQELRDQCANLPDAGTGDLPTGDLPDVPIPGFPSLDDLPASDLQELCDLLLTPPDSVLSVGAVHVWCKGDTGAVDVANLKVLGQAVDVPSTAPNTSLPANPLVGLTVNKQTKNADGSFTVSGLVIDLGDGSQTITLGSATCAKPAAKHHASPTPTAPTPTPVVTTHPVTG
jgi:phage baseplate assembly protein gpV